MGGPGIFAFGHASVGFQSKMVRLAFGHSVNYSVALNGVEFGPTEPHRRLTHGYPLSPYLFIRCVEGLSTLFKYAERRGDIHGIRIY